MPITPPTYSQAVLIQKMWQAIQQGHSDIAKIYAQNAIRKQNERLNLLRLGSRIDAVASRVQTAVTMRQVTGSMMNVVKGMDQAMKAMDLEKVCLLSPTPHLRTPSPSVKWKNG
jgi:division protein CdvB (Snf7/Vps24/ESCRT-III family)